MAKKTDSMEDDILQYDSLNKKLEFIRSGIELLDAFIAGEMSINFSKIGFPIGKIISLTGKNAIGKSTLMLDTSKRFCLQGYKVLYIDSERGLNTKSIKSYGLMDFAAYNPEIEEITDVKKIKELKMECLRQFLEGEKLFYSISPETYIDAIKVIKYIYSVNKKGQIALMVIDSIKDLVSKKVLDDDEDTENQQMMIDAKSQEYFLKKLKHFLAFEDTVCMLLNQVRVKKKGSFFVEGEAGSNAFLHRCDGRIIVKEKKKIVQIVTNNLGEPTEKAIGNWIELQYIKSRFGNSDTKICIPMIFGKGVSLIYLYKEILQSNNIIKKSTSWYTFSMPQCNIEEKYQGEAGSYSIIKNNFDNIKKYILDNGLLYIEKKDEEEDNVVEKDLEDEIEESATEDDILNMTSNNEEKNNKEE